MKPLDEEQLKAVYYAKDNIYKGKTFEELLKEEGLIKEEFEVGKYYWIINGWICYQGEGRISYGVHVKEWGTNLHKTGGCNPMTEKEVIDALIKEWEKNNHGFINYRFCNGLLQGTNRCLDVSSRTNWKTLFNSGKWAEIIPEKKELTIEEIEKELGHSVKIIKG